MSKFVRKLKAHKGHSKTLILAFLLSISNSALADEEPKAELEEEFFYDALARSNERILNGRILLPTEGAWSVSIQKNRRHHCGGVLIQPDYSSDGSKVDGWLGTDWKTEDGLQWILTAAHCVDGADEIKSNLTVISGTLKLSDFKGNDAPIPKGEKHQVLDIIPNPSYTNLPLENDIALIKISDPTVKLSKSARRPIEIAKSDIWARNDLAYRSVYPQGWGTTETGFPNNSLLEAAIPIVDRETCKQTFSNKNLTKLGFETKGQTINIPDENFCAGFKGGIDDACSGDSGGAVILRKNKKFASQDFIKEETLLGLVSWGIDCGHPNLFSVYTDVSSFTDWIIRTVINYR